REAVILRRLLGRHRGALPPQAIMRIWRELFSAALMIEGDLTIAVADGPQMDITSLAREHFGPLTPLRRHPTPAQAMADLTSAAAQVAVLPLPSPADDAAGSWWIGLMQCGAPRLQIVARLPFWARRPEGTPQAGAYVVGALEPDASGADRSLLGLEIAADASTAKVTAALKEAGFSVGSLLQRRLPRQETAYALADVEGLVSRSDPRLAAIAGLASKPELLGGYAVPFPPGEMAEPA
ncbi:MAG TPA: chorismate mutase, partial [Acetobacteraceae bacterium]|nr:chorismate mutase [Acetobacteraceae bacterium]